MPMPMTSQPANSIPAPCARAERRETRGENQTRDRQYAAAAEKIDAAAGKRPENSVDDERGRECGEDKSV